MLTKADSINFIKKHLAIFFRDITSLGGMYFYVLLLLFLIILGEMDLFWQLLMGLVLIMIIAIGIRLVYFKDRPNRENHSNVLERIDASSFPSIHAGRIWFICFVIGSNFQLAVKIFLVLLAIAVSYSRIHLRKHDYFDLSGGFVLAIITYFISSFLF